MLAAFEAPIVVCALGLIRQLSLKRANDWKQKGQVVDVSLGYLFKSVFTEKRGKRRSAKTTAFWHRNQRQLIASIVFFFLLLQPYMFSFYFTISFLFLYIFVFAIVVVFVSIDIPITE